jgi:diguanylate cyclase (GGDEF)-like protein
MLFVLILDGAGYFIAVSSISGGQTALTAALEDIFVVVALLTICVGLVLPGMITHSAAEVSDAAKRLTSGTLKEFSCAMAALGRGDLDAAHVSIDIVPVKIVSHDELGELGKSFNVLQEEVREAALGLHEAREKMHIARTELLMKHEQIAHLAHHDPLTDLPNRTVLAIKLAEAFDLAKADGSSFAVLTVDLDHFKEANDVFGHAVGDELLCAISRRLHAAAQGAFIARIGGDEFTLILAKGEQPAAAEALADRLLKTLAQDFEVRGQKIPLGLSVGIAIYPKDASDPLTLQANADAALYRAKSDGRHVACFFHPEMDRHLRERYSLQHDLRSAIANDELRLHYQPQATIEEMFSASRPSCVGNIQNTAWSRRPRSFRLRNRMA